MVIVNSKKYTDSKFRISTGELIVCDVIGNAAITEEAWELMQEKYPNYEFTLVEENVEILSKDDESTGKELLADEPEDVDVELITMINDCTKINELKEIAKELEFPVAEWRSRKDKASFKEYLIEKIKK